MALTTEWYIGSYDDTHTSTPILGPDATVADVGLVADTLAHIGSSPAEGMDSDVMSDEGDVMSDEDDAMSGKDNMPCKDMDSDSELDKAFGLGEDDNPFLLLEDALFTEMHKECGLSGVLLLKQHPVFC